MEALSINLRILKHAERPNQSKQLKPGVEQPTDSVETVSKDQPLNFASKSQVYQHKQDALLQKQSVSETSSDQEFL